MLYFIVNKKSKSGKGAKVWQEVQGILIRKKIHYKAWITEYEGHAFSLAEKICEMVDEDICLVAVGGDGTANEVINGIVHWEKVRFGMIPTGSGNDFARGLGIQGTTEQNLDRILNGMKLNREDTASIDLGRVSFQGGQKSRLFAISAGIGLDAIVCKKALKSKVKALLNKLHLGKLTYLFLTVQSLFSMETTDAVICFDRKDKIGAKKVIFVAAMNFRAEGGGIPMAPDADACDGKLSVCQVCGIPKWKTFFCLPFLVAARHVNMEGFLVSDCVDCDIKLKHPMVLHTDGEYCGEVSELHFECLPGKLSVFR